MTKWLMVRESLHISTHNPQVRQLQNTVELQVPQTILSIRDSDFYFLFPETKHTAILT